MLFIDNFNRYKKKIDDILSILFYFFFWKSETDLDFPCKQIYLSS